MALTRRQVQSLKSLLRNCERLENMHPRSRAARSKLARARATFQEKEESLKQTLDRLSSDRVCTVYDAQELQTTVEQLGEFFRCYHQRMKSARTRRFVQVAADAEVAARCALLDAQALDYDSNTKEELQRKRLSPWARHGFFSDPS